MLFRSLGIWAQIDFDERYPFTKSSLEVIKKIRLIIKNRNIDKLTLYKNDLYVLIVAGEIIGYKRKEITKMFSMLPIKSLSDLKITTEVIVSILDIKPSIKIKQIYEDLELKVLNNELKNNNNAIKKYILKNWK